MTKGISQIVFAKDRPLRDVLRFAVDAGYQAVELCMRPEGELALDATPDDYRRLAALAREFGVTYTSVLPLCGGALTSNDAEERARASAVFTKCMEAAQALEVGHVLCVPGYVGPDIRDDVAHRRAKEGLEQLAPAAEQRQVHLCIENVWNKMFMSPTELRWFVTDLGSPWINVYLDVGNMLIWGFPEHWIGVLGQQIRRVHFKDFRREGYQFVQLMDGDVNWAAVVKGLRDVGYAGPVISEVDGPDETLRETSARMDTVLALA